MSIDKNISLVLHSLGERPDVPNSRRVVELMLNAGYRKFEIVDEPTAAKWPKTGGPIQGAQAYWNDPGTHGLTIRDYFAIHANADEVTALQNRYLADHEDDIGLSDIQARYRYADEMLKERAK